jgi:glycosyltransferase involved in cell wall biosynthesis
MATGQYLTEVAVRLIERGHQVTVVTSRRAYDHPETQFPKRETWRGIRIYRVGGTGFGKDAKWRRGADFASFILCCCARLVLLPKHDRVVALTTPPLISFIGAWLARLWRAPFVYWVMDFNPDEAVAAGWLRSGSLAALLLDATSRLSLRRAQKIIALDRFMRDRIMAKGIPAEKIVVIPPWSHDTEVRFDAQGRERFRCAHGLDGKFVVMYSGNHSPVHPLHTLLQAAERMRSDDGVVFCFVGGGSEWRKIKETADYGTTDYTTTDYETTDVTKQELGEQKAESRKQEPESRNFSVSAFQRFSVSNLLCLPYQPLDQLAGSLSAADLHVVVMGNDFVGLVHPCKIYNILRVAAPVLYIGPRPSHLSEMLDELNGEYPCASAAHGEVGGVVREIERLRREAGSAGRQTPARVRARFSQEVLLPRLVAELEAAERTTRPRD